MAKRPEKNPKSQNLKEFDLENDAKIYRIGTVMRITVASGVILISLSLAERMAPGLLDIGCLEAKSAPICMMLAPVL